MTATKLRTNVPAPASAEARATKSDRVAYLTAWALENPLMTNEEAREAIRKQYGISLGTSIISQTMRMARDTWESQRREAAKRHGPMLPPGPPASPHQEIPPLQQQISEWARSMKAAGIRLIEILPDGGVRFELFGL